MKLAKAEAAELATRVDAARNDAVARGASSALADLERAVDASQAVVNVQPDFLRQLLLDDKALYAPYAKLMAAGIRAPALFENDAQRTAVEGMLFASFGEEIVYAALALDGRGLGSYGPVSMELKPEMISHRASVLEENSYTFVKKRHLSPFDALPRGHRAAWADRSQIGAAKLAHRVLSTTTGAEHAELVLSSDGADRSKDDFIEVHIFGSFDRRAIGKITMLAMPLDPAEQIRMEALRETTDRNGLNVVWSGL